MVSTVVSVTLAGVCNSTLPNTSDCEPSYESGAIRMSLQLNVKGTEGIR